MANITPIPTTPLPKPSPKAGGLGEKVFNLWVNGWVEVANHLLTPISKTFQHSVEITLEGLEDEMLELIRPFLLDIRNEPGMPESIKTRIDYVINTRRPAWLLAIIPLLFPLLQAVINLLTPVIATRINNVMNRIFKPFRLPFNITWLAGRIDPNIEKITRGDLLDQGWDDHRIELAIAAQEQRLPAPQLGQLVLRGEMSGATMVNELFVQGWKREHAEAYLKLLQLIPGPGDLISMAVREAWDENFARIGQTDEGLPSEFVEWAAKQGISADWSKRYWRAHWQLPSVQMGLEMLHRHVIDPGTFDALLKALDISPGWRDKIKDIGYSVPTRVDLRRAYKDQVIDRAEVKGGYLDAGYNEKWAEILTKWTEVAYAPEEKEVTVSDVRSALETGMLSEPEATEVLQSLDVGDEAIAFYIAQARFKRAQKLKASRISAIESKFVSGKYDRSAAATALSALSLPASEIEIYLDEWQAAREAKVKQPTEAQLRGFYLDDLIAADVFQSELKKLGYDDDDIALYVRQADADKDRAVKAEIERAQKEQDRLSKAEQATAYQKSVAALNAQIAEQQQAIVNAQAALNAGLSDAQMRDTEDAISQIDEQIAAERKTIATYNEQRTIAQNMLNAKVSATLRARLDGQVADAQTTIQETNQALAALDTEIAQAKLALLTSESDEEKAALKLDIADKQVTQAQLRETIEAQQLVVTNARNQLRAYITDDERQTLEATIRDADEAIKKSQTSIATYQAQQTTLKNQIGAALNSDQRVALATAIDDARKRIAELQVTRAEARVGE